MRHFDSSLDRLKDKQNLIFVVQVEKRVVFAGHNNRQTGYLAPLVIFSIEFKIDISACEVNDRV